MKRRRLIRAGDAKEWSDDSKRGKKIDGGLRKVSDEHLPMLTRCPAPNVSLASDPMLVCCFRDTPIVSEEEVDTRSEFSEFMKSQVDMARSTQHSWIRDPDAAWMVSLERDLTAEDKELIALRRTKTAAMIAAEPDTDMFKKWHLRTLVAEEILLRWFSLRTFEEVCEKAKQLGHMNEGMCSGTSLTGQFVRKHIVVAKPLTISTLLPTIRTLTPPGDEISLYTVLRENSLQLDPVQSVSRTSVVSENYLENAAQRGEAMGCLNTVYDYSANKGEPCGDPLMDTYYEALSSTIARSKRSKLHELISLNPRMYFLWKFENYATSYHQDVHVPPHFTLYNQISGCSVFHFLPVLIGMYITHVAKMDPPFSSAQRVSELLRKLDEMGIGNLATVGEGDAILIPPFSTHGVYVPPHRINRSIGDFNVSAIRAAELFVAPTLRELEKQSAAVSRSRSLSPKQDNKEGLKEDDEQEEEEYDGGSTDDDDDDDDDDGGNADQAAAAFRRMQQKYMETMEKLNAIQNKSSNDN